MGIPPRILTVNRIPYRIWFATSHQEVETKISFPLFRGNGSWCRISRIQSSRCRLLLIPDRPFFSKSAAWFFPDHRQKIFRTLPQMAWGGELFSSDIMWWLGDWIRLILHQLPLPRKSLKRGKIILVSTSWWEVANHIRYGIRYTVPLAKTHDPLH